MALTAAELNAVYSVDEAPLKKSLDGLGGLVKGAVAGLAGLKLGQMLADGIFSGLDQERVTDKLAAQIGAGSPLAASAGEVAGRLYGNAYGESLGEAADAVRSVLQGGLLPEDATNDQIESMTSRVMDLATTFDQDLGGTTNAVAQMIRTGLAKDGAEALDILTRGFQQGDDKAGDLLDTFNEYGGQFQKLGLDGTAAMGLISQAVKGGARDSDVAADALKEFSIRAIDGSKTTVEGFELVGLNADKMREKIAAGGEGAREGLGQVLDGLRGIEDPALRAQAATALFGTQAEDLGAALYAMDTSTAVRSMGNVEGAAARMGEALNDNAATNIDSFKRQAQMAFVDVLGGKVLPFISSTAKTLTTEFGPAVVAVGGFLQNNVLPAAKAVFGFLADHTTTVTVIAGLIGGVLVTALGVWAVRSVIAAATNAAAWVSTAVSAQTGAAAQSRSALQVAIGWAVMAAKATLHAAKVVASWLLVNAVSFVGFLAGLVAAGAAMAVTAAQATASAAVTAAQWVAAQVRTIASLAVMAAGFVAQGAVMVASAAVTAAGVVAGWVVMGTQSLIQAARMAAAWFIALGPVGWVIAAVIGLVALIVANWDTVVSWTQTAWSAVTGAIGAAWEWIKGAASAALGFLVTLFLNFTGPGLIIKHWQSIVDFTRSAWSAVTGAVSGAWSAVTGAVSSGVSSAVSWVAGLPGRVVGALGNMGSLLYNSGRNLIQGLINGAGSLLKNIGRFFLDMVPGWIRGPFEKALGIASPSKVFAGYGENIGQGLINGMAGMRPAVAAQMQALADTQALQGLMPSGLDRVRLGDVSGQLWDKLLSAGWKGRAGDNMEALYRPADAPAASTGGGPLFTVGVINEMSGTTEDLARKLAVEARTALG